jgi:hypothetical protein
VNGDPSCLVLTLPEPPSLNEMLDMAKKRARVGKRMLPVVYSGHKQAWEAAALIRLRIKGIVPPRTPWKRWKIEQVDFRLHSLRDPVELLASLKFPVDALVKGRYVEDDSPRHLLSVPMPTQVIDRSNRGITLTISRVDDE